MPPSQPERTTPWSLYYGQEEAPVETWSLRAGPLTLLYEAGDLRNVRCGRLPLRAAIAGR